MALLYCKEEERDWGGGDWALPARGTVRKAVRAHEEKG